MHIHDHHDHVSLADSYHQLHQPGNYKPGERRRLFWAMVITLITMCVEVVGGIVSNSIALLSDAGHMMTHFFALLISFVAIKLATIDPSHKKTFGYFRAEVIAALINGLFLLVVSAFIVYESIIRLLSQQPVEAKEMFAIALIGLVVNIITIFIVGVHHEHDRNIRSAVVHMIADSLSSVAVVAGAIVIYFFGWTFIDPLLGIVIAVLIVIWAWSITADSIGVLMQSVPKGLDTRTIKSAILANDNRISEIPDMHIVEITGGMFDLAAVMVVATGSLLEADEIIDATKRMLAERFNIKHATIQPVPVHGHAK